MKHYFSRKFRNIKGLFCYANKGFTLIETLIAVGILVILLAVSIPSVITIQKNLKMQELDDIARQIFLLSQSELTEMKSSGRLETFKKELTAEYNSQKLTQKPSDYDKVGDSSRDDLKWKDFYYLNGTDDVMEKHIIRQVSSLGAYLEGGSFIVELNPETGDVYGAFYSPKPGVSYANDILTLANRGRDARVATQIGYYGGEAGSSASSTLPTNFLPTIEVINKEDLYIKFECTNLQSILKTQSLLKLTITVTDEANDSWEKTFTAGTDFNISAAGNISYNILLDSLRPNEGFAKLTNNNLKAGDNIKIAARLDYDNNETTITGSAAEQTVNSLFGKKENTGGKTDIDIAYLRHLNNLRESIYVRGNVPTGEITLNQSRNIDFDVNNWKEPNIVMPNKAKPTLTSFATITNTALLERGAGATTTYNGNGNSLLTFPLAGANGATQETYNVGLFSSAKNMTFKGMRLVDFSLKGIYYNAGMLVGTLTNGKVIDVRAHLSTEDAEGRHYDIEMPKRLDEYYIHARSNIGGLIGVSAGNTMIERSFAAVPIDAVDNVGGLVGSFEGGEIINSYGSGNIKATSAAGGLCGVITGRATVTNCYSTSNLEVGSFAGGLVGRTINLSSTFKNSRSYGLVTRRTDKDDTKTFGGFLGAQAVANTYTNCSYLQQDGYNKNFEGAVSRVYGNPTGYANLIPETSNTPDSTHPYLEVLVGKAFAFPLITAGTGTSEITLPHYGAWPEEATLPTSLVYYERYEDGTYGYYAKTSITQLGGESQTAANLWVVDTLKNKACVEDGYALMTTFKLSRFEYKLEKDVNATNVTALEGATGAGANKAPLIQTGVTVRFENGLLTKTIANAKVYQLPFKLQVAERGEDIKSFFLKLNINGYVGEKAVEKKVIDNFNFYYCPDFAKNAVNPEIDKSVVGGYPADPVGEANPIYVRSPRQLNGLSRYKYYWNDENNGIKGKFYFKQETELDYSKYVTNYCGVTYNLMDTSQGNIYRNRPIGRPTHIDGSQFRNIYDGSFNKIVDYRSEVYASDDYQFTGLFGEVRMCTLKNIILTASKPGEEGTASSAYVKSYYNNSAYKSGTGALVGLVYVAPEDSYNDAVATVSNCVVSGYDVETTASLTNDSAVGGLVGYNFGTIKNSSANNKTVVANSNNNTARYLGGLAGSINGKGKIENCYAGGVLKSNSRNVVVGGISAGYNSIYGWGDETPSRNQLIKESYSHCTWKDSNLKNGTFYPVAPQVDSITVNYCYYLTNSVEQAVIAKFDNRDSSEGKGYAELREMAVDPKPTELSNFGKAATTHPWLIKGKNYPFPAIVKDAAGKFVHYGDWYESDAATPSSILVYYEKYSDDKGAESYGYQFVETAGLKAYNGLKDNTFDITEAGYGVLVLEEEGSLADVWVNSTKVTFGTSTGAFTAASGDKYNLRPISNSDDLGKAGATANVVLSYAEIKDGVNTNKTQALYVNFNFAATVSLKPLVSTEANPTQVRTERQLRKLSTGVAKEYYKMTHNIVIKNYGETQTGMIVNKGYTFDGGYVAGGGGAQRFYFGGRWVGKNGNFIFGLTAPLFDANSGVIKNVALLGVNVQADYAAALVLENNGKRIDAKQGEVQNCFAQGDVTGNSIAAGLVFRNSGTIENSYFSGKVTAATIAAGFVYENSSFVLNSYAVGEVKSSGSNTTSGFVHSNAAYIFNSYSAMRVAGNGDRNGFAASGGNTSFSECHWRQDSNINAGINDGGKIKPMVYSEFVSNGNKGLFNKINGDEIWRLGATAYPYPNGGAPTYPYPALNSQDFYGNWPEE